MLKFLKKRISTPIAIEIILVLTVLIAGLVAWQYLGIPKKEIKAPKEEELPVGWQRYQRPATIFSFRYPEKWIVDDEFYIVLRNEEGEGIIRIESGNLPFYYPTSTLFCMTYPENNRCEVLKTDKYSTSIDWDPESGEGAIAKILIPEEYTTESWTLIVTLYKADPSTENIFRQILTSFKFIKPTIDISNWQTYRSEESGFEVKYPPQWQCDDWSEWFFQLFPNPETVSQEIQEIRDIPSFYIAISGIPIDDRSLSLRELFNKDMLPDLIDIELDVNPQIQEVKINNFDALTFFDAIRGIRVYIVFHPYRANRIIQIYFRSNELDLRGITTIQTFNKILSTFKFLE